MDNGELRGLDQVEDAGQKFSLVDPDKELIYLAPASQQQGKSLFCGISRMENIILSVFNSGSWEDNRH